jgi:hypothetical protein
MSTEAGAVVTTFAAVRPPTEEEKRCALEALAQARRLGAAILARRRGEPLAESWPIIREEREERADEL